MKRSRGRVWMARSTTVKQLAIGDISDGMAGYNDIPPLAESSARAAWTRTLYNSAAPQAQPSFIPIHGDL
jgi:hypothetical protein